MKVACFHIKKRLLSGRKVVLFRVFEYANAYQIKKNN
jgi:hypothetical protein